MPRTAEPTYAVQLVRPFLDVLSSHPRVPAGLIDPNTPDDLRLPVAQGQEFLREMVKLTGEPDLGLIAAQRTAPGAFDVLEYVAHSAPTWRAAVETTFRYSRLMNEAANFRIEEQGDRVHLVLDSTVPLTRAGIDFQNASFYLSAVRWFGQPDPDLEVHFSYPAPDDVHRHREVFGPARLRFGERWNGFTQDRSTLERPTPKPDPVLHRALRQHADQLLAQLAPAGGLVEEVRGILLSSLKNGSISAETVAARLGLSRRTLTRRLASQDTSFSALRDAVRKQAAHHYLISSDQTVDDIAFLLGFAESSVFVRAFKRWYGEGPTSYRRTRRS